MSFSELFVVKVRTRHIRLWKVSLSALTDINILLLNSWQLVKCPQSPSALFSHIPLMSGFGGLVVSMLVSGTQDRGFDPGQSRRIFRAKKSTASLPWGGSKAVSHVADLRGMSKNPGFTWKSKSQAKLTGHFSPVIPSFADRGLSCHLHVEAPRGESGNV